MNRYSPSEDLIVKRASSGLQTYLSQVYGWMTCGLLLTAFVAWYLTQTPELLNFIFQNRMVTFGLIIVQLGLVFILSGLIHKLSATAATALFMLYSALTGLTIATIFLIYTYSSICSTFFITAGMFGAMSFYGYTTKRDLSGFRNMLFMALIGLIIASVVNFWFKKLYTYVDYHLCRRAVVCWFDCLRYSEIKKYWSTD